MLKTAKTEQGARRLMSPRMRPLIRGMRITGPAVTAHCAPGDNLMIGLIVADGDGVVCVPRLLIIYLVFRQSSG